MPSASSAASPVPAARAVLDERTIDLARLCSHVPTSAWHVQKCKIRGSANRTTLWDTSIQFLTKETIAKTNLNDDFHCSPTSTKGGSLHGMRGSRPRRTSGNIERHAETMSASPTTAFLMSSPLPKFQLVVLLVERQPLEEPRQRILTVAVRTSEATPNMQT